MQMENVAKSMHFFRFTANFGCPRTVGETEKLAFGFALFVWRMGVVKREFPIQRGRKHTRNRHGVPPI